MPRAHHKPWRRGAMFNPGPSRRLDREQRARFRFLTRAHARTGRLPAKAEWVAEALLKRLGQDGQCDPAHVTLAADAGCSTSTVRRALTRMADLGLVRWAMRLVRSGWRTEQTSNQYELIPTGENPVPRAARCGVHSGRATITDRISTVFPMSPEAAQAALAALADRRAVMEARMLRKW